MVTKKDISRTWIVGFGEFPDQAIPDSRQTHVLAPPSIAAQFSSDSGTARLRGGKKVTKGH